MGLIAGMYGLALFLLSIPFIPISVLERSFKRIENETLNQRIIKFSKVLLKIGETIYLKFFSKYKFFHTAFKETDELLKKLWIKEVNAESIVGLQFTLAFTIALTGLLISSPFLLMSGALLIVVVQMVLKNKWKKRKNEMSKDILSLAELTAVGVSAGLSPLESLGKAVEGRDRPLNEEIRVAINKINMGELANETFLELTKRIDLQEMYAFMDQLIQVVETGSPGFAQSVIEIVRHLREIRQSKIEETAGKAEGKLLVPLLFFFGAIISFLLGPLSITFLEVF
ncbi:MAG: type II secretion system F family protein [Tepidibacillus sp.]